MTNFETLKRPSKPNNFLVCDTGHCQQAAADMPPPVFDYPPEIVQTAWDRVIARQPRTQLSARQPEINQYEYVQRSALMKFPDTITVRFLSEQGGASTKILIWSRSKIGYSDWGVNKKRVTGWLAELADELVENRR